MRYFVARLISWPMRWTGWRFTNHYRMATEGWRVIVYSCCSTVAANDMANGGSRFSTLREWLDATRS